MDAIRPAAPRRFVALCAVAAVAWVLSVCIGATRIYSPAEVFRAAFQAADTDHQILWVLRVPRALAALMVGAALGQTGALFQMLFRNPLAEPYVVGVSSGAALGGAVLVAGGWGAALGGLAVPLGAAAAAMVVLLVLLSVTRNSSRTSAATLLLSGVVLGALIQGALTVVLVLAGEDTNRILRWLLGDLSSATWSHLGWFLAVGIVCTLSTVPLLRSLNLIAMGEEQALAMGVSVARARTALLVAGTILTATAVGIAGLIGFVGLVAPHLARRTVGVDARHSVPAAALWGAILLVLADLVAQRAAGGVIQVPIGAVTAILGAPLILWVLRNRSMRLI